MTGAQQLGSTFLVFSLVLAFALPADAAFFKRKNPDEKRAEIQEIRKKSLSRLFEQDPSVEALVKKAEGYAVFSNFGMNLGVLSTASGKGIAHDNKAGKDVYMKMYSVGGGLGLGVKTFSAVFVFHSRSAFTQFVVEGWDFSGQADAAATTDADEKEQAGAMDESLALMKEVSVYQLTDKGLALQVTLQGTKYWQDGKLN